MSENNKANLELIKENENLKRNNLFIKEINVDGGPTLKRWLPKAMGRATPLIKRSSHISLVLAEKVPTVGTDKVKKEDTKDDLIKIEDLGKISRQNKTEDKKEEKKPASSGRQGGPVSQKIVNKIFNRRTGS